MAQYVRIACYFPTCGRGGADQKVNSRCEAHTILVGKLPGQFPGGNSAALQTNVTTNAGPGDHPGAGL